MSLETVSLAFRSPRGEGVAFVVDASSVGPERERTVSLVSKVLGRLHADTRRSVSVFFFGNPNAYPGDEFSRRALVWFKENETRLRVIWPVVQTLCGRDVSRMVALFPGRIYDLKDYLNDDFRAKFLVVSDSAGSQFTQAGVEICRGNTAAVEEAVHDPPRLARITGRGFMPLWWTNTSYELEVDGDGVSLVAKGPDDYAVEFSGLAEPGARLSCTLTRESGKKARGHLEQTVGGNGGATSRTLLSEKEAKAFRRASRGESFECPCCSDLHRWDILTCNYRDDGFGFGQPVYEALQGKKGLAVFELEPGGGISCEGRLAQGLRLSPNRVAVKEGGKLSLWEWTTTSQSWQTVEQTPGPYQPLGDGRYVVSYR